jgi:hypothetical protein
LINLPFRLLEGFSGGLGSRFEEVLLDHGKLRAARLHPDQPAQVTTLHLNAIAAIRSLSPVARMVSFSVHH